MSGEFSTRSATESDLSAIAAIYSHAVEHSVATFDLEPPDQVLAAEVRGRPPG